LYDKSNQIRDSKRERERERGGGDRKSRAEDGGGEGRGGGGNERGEAGCEELAREGREHTVEVEETWRRGRVRRR
jgi:hypothetical protein